MQAHIRPQSKGSITSTHLIFPFFLQQSDVWTKTGDCTRHAGYCVRIDARRSGGYCSVSGCTDSPEDCLDGYHFLDLSVFAPGLPTICEVNE